MARVNVTGLTFSLAFQSLLVIDDPTHIVQGHLHWDVRTKKRTINYTCVTDHKLPGWEHFID